MKTVQPLIDFCRSLIEKKRLTPAQAEQLDRYMFAVICEIASMDKKLQDVYAGRFGDLEKIAHLLFCFGVTDAVMMQVSQENLEFIGKYINQTKFGERLNITKIVSTCQSIDGFKNMHSRMPVDMTELRAYYYALNIKNTTE